MQKYQEFEIEGIVSIIEDVEGLSKIIIENSFAEAEIYLLGGNLTHFSLKGGESVIFDGKQTKVYCGKTLHAGIPICWPWFGPHPTDSNKPQHGFVRNMLWDIVATEQLPSGETKVILGVSEDTDSLLLFDYAFDLQVTFVIGESLSVELETTNRGVSAFTITQALHSYFAISDIENVTIYGVEDQSFVDYTDSNKIKSEPQPLAIDRILNRVYLPSDSTCRVEDLGYQRAIIVEKESSNSTTIWNPGVDNGIHDLPDDTYRRFVCIETTNAREDSVKLQPNEVSYMRQIVSIR